jgi:hypothetical protein
MYSRQLEQLANQRPNELKATNRPTKPGRRTRTTNKPLRRQTGWVLVSIGLRLAESGNR